MASLKPDKEMSMGQKTHHPKAIILGFCPFCSSARTSTIASWWRRRKWNQPLVEKNERQIMERMYGYVLLTFVHSCISS